MYTKNFNDTIGNRTRDLPTCSAMPQPTALPRAPFCIYISVYAILSPKMSLLFMFPDQIFCKIINPLNAELNPICYLLALSGAHHFLHVSRIRVKSLILRLHWTTNFKTFFVSVMNMLLMYLLVSIKVQNGHKKILGSSFKIMLPLWYFIK